MAGKKTLRGLAAAVIVGVPLILGSGCTARMYENKLIRGVFGKTQEVYPEFLQSGTWKNYKKMHEGPWAGTAIINRTMNPDGSIVFVLDTEKLGPGKKVSSMDSDRFVDISRYNKKATITEDSHYITVIYTPKEKVD